MGCPGIAPSSSASSSSQCLHNLFLLFQNAHRASCRAAVPPKKGRAGSMASNSSECSPDSWIGQLDRHLGRGHWREQSGDWRSPRPGVLGLLQLGWLQAAHHLQRQEDPHYRSEEWQCWWGINTISLLESSLSQVFCCCVSIGSDMSRRFQGNEGHLPAQRTRLYDWFL